MGYTSTTCRSPGKPYEPSFTIIGTEAGVGLTGCWAVLGAVSGSPGIHRVPPVPPLQSTSGGLRNCPHSEARQRVAADQNHPKYDFLKGPSGSPGRATSPRPRQLCFSAPGGAVFAEVQRWRVVRGPAGALMTGPVVFGCPGDPKWSVATGSFAALITSRELLPSPAARRAHLSNRPPDNLVPKHKQIVHAVLIRDAHVNVYVRLGWPFRPVTDSETANRWICVVAFTLFDLVCLPDSITQNDPHRLRVQCWWYGLFVNLDKRNGSSQSSRVRVDDYRHEVPPDTCLKS